MLGIPERKLENINNRIYEMLTIPASHKNNETDTITVEDILSQGIIKIETLKSKNVYPKITNTNTLQPTITQQLTNSSDSVIKLDICFLIASSPTGSNCIDTVQNTDTCHNTRKYKITGSRLPSLLGIYGKTKT